MPLIIFIITFLLPVKEISSLAPSTKTNKIKKSIIYRQKFASSQPQIKKTPINYFDTPSPTIWSQGSYRPFQKAKPNKPLNQSFLKQFPLSVHSWYWNDMRRLTQTYPRKKRILFLTSLLFYIGWLLTTIVMLVSIGVFFSGTERIIALVVYSFLFLIILFLVTILIGSIYKVIKPRNTYYPELFFQPYPNPIKIKYKKEPHLTQNIYLPEATIKKLEIHLSLSPVGAYTVLKSNKTTYFLFAKINLQDCLVFKILPDQAENFPYIKKLLNFYLDKNTPLSPFSIYPNQDLKGNKITFGAGVGFELEGELYFAQNNFFNKHWKDCPCENLPNRGPTHYPAFYTTVSTPQVDISYDTENNLELISHPIRSSTPSDTQEANNLIFYMIETWRGIEEQSTQRYKPLHKVLQKIENKTGIWYTESKDPNNTLNPSSIYIGLHGKQKPVYKCLQCTYSIPIESLSSPILPLLDSSQSYKQASQKAKELTQIDLSDTLFENFKNLTVHDLKKIEGFFTALFYVLKVYQQNNSYILRTLKSNPLYAKFKFKIYIKHSLYDLFSLLPAVYQDFFTHLSQEPNNILYTNIAKHLKTKLRKKKFLASWYTSDLLGKLPKHIKKTNYSLHELLDILFQRKEEEKEVWFIDDDSLDFDRNQDDFTSEKNRILVELRIFHSANNLDSSIKVHMQESIESAGYLSAYNTIQHLFESVQTARCRRLKPFNILKSA